MPKTYCYLRYRYDMLRARKRQDTWNSELLDDTEIQNNNFRRMTDGE